MRRNRSLVWKNVCSSKSTLPQRRTVRVCVPPLGMSSEILALRFPVCVYCKLMWKACCTFCCASWSCLCLFLGNCIGHTVLLRGVICYLHCIPVEDPLPFTSLVICMDINYEALLYSHTVISLELSLVSGNLTLPIYNTGCRRAQGLYSL
jgi:hypothetical protein